MVSMSSFAGGLLQEEGVHIGKFLSLTQIAVKGGEGSDCSFLQLKLLSREGGGSSGGVGAEGDRTGVIRGSRRVITPIELLPKARLRRGMKGFGIEKGRNMSMKRRVIKVIPSER